jgi:hypothetical protein
MATISAHSVRRAVSAKSSKPAQCCVDEGAIEYRRIADRDGGCVPFDRNLAMPVIAAMSPPAFTW